MDFTLLAVFEAKLDQNGGNEGDVEHFKTTFSQKLFLFHNLPQRPTDSVTTVH
ncbi:hypothetical protein L1049_014828 [Liquidambar formosana]|uniref:Uncharacterized protein n=1 Tax=Liquidambar formosana TaxID=63359 RepID=A0AAP0RX13_LIQFO